MFFMHLCKQSTRWKDVHILLPARVLHHVPPLRSLWTEMPVSTAFFYISLRDPSGRALQIVTRF